MMKGYWLEQVSMLTSYEGMDWTRSPFAAAEEGYSCWFSVVDQLLELRRDSAQEFCMANLLHACMTVWNLGAGWPQLAKSTDDQGLTTRR
ncbi:hypothetical protein AK812_SmicGene17868 [Symbiodinium microadriaticum]|uniref:Uncharacterized protein n=1 Tax=Symbiodinium microadriaticum TaxID=2951 RepID=A0A1Q9DWM4_SYMMI|nr:hypothetical protein AK812_SmicGene17868 [Symbiodinium microadriaticum]